MEPTMGAYRGRVLAIGFTDDQRFGCRRAVEALHRHYENADLTYDFVAPERLGRRNIGHFGYFRDGARPLWDETLAWIGSDSLSP
jgi:predicted alpha/beta hydrolase